MKKVLFIALFLVVGFVFGVHASKCPVMKSMCPLSKDVCCDDGSCCVVKCNCGDQCFCCKDCCKK
jgi:hypothetical protein